MKRRNLILYAVIFFLSYMQTISLSAQTMEKEIKGIFYYEFGSHRNFYTKSDLHLKRESPTAFEFILKDVRAKDEGGLRFHTAPQFSYRLGYYFKKKNFGLEYSYDHIKYFVRQGQIVHMKGTIEGHPYDQDTLINPAFLKYEHSDGGNYAMINFVKWIPLALDKKKNLRLELIAKAGAGVVNPKTNSTIMGVHRDDKYHISGFVTGIESGLRYHFLKYLFVTGTFKGTYANYKDILIYGGRASQKWFSGQFIYLLGAQIKI